MRVVLIGNDDERATLRDQLNGSATVVGEFPTLGEARAAIEQIWLTIEGIPLLGSFGELTV